MNLTFPADLPVSARKDEIAAAIRDHQVVIVAGQTGSGKTTQLPKICLELGRGTDGRLIGHTQPRRIAARAVATRIADELGTPLGEVVGYQVRFEDHSRKTARVKVMTDGILLAEISRDRLLKRYDTLIIDEAHERTLNIDFLLGYLKQLLPRRPDLKVIITSATIDTSRFSEHFDNAPVIDVAGRTYPVEIRYRPLNGLDQEQGIRTAVRELAHEPPGDILVFCSGEREIRDAAEALRSDRGIRDTGAEILPLYARLTAEEQQRIFAPHTGRRIIIATNIAETSLTVPGVRYVVDTGTARISRYRNHVQHLPIEPVSQASANQRAGRSGRTAPGICVRLYSQDDFDQRPPYTDPEILRTNLASVILQLTALGLGDLSSFPFLDPPDPAHIKEGIDLLHELGALDSRDRLTPIGRKLAKLPLDPRHGRIILEADRRHCTDDALIITAALSIQDPRERPAAVREEADRTHSRHTHPDSDFLSFLNLWDHLHGLTGSQLRRVCREEFLNHLRVREWQDIVSRLRRTAEDTGLRLGHPPAGYEDIHRSLLAGLRSQVGLLDGTKREYTGLRGTRFAPHPGSAVFADPPQWVMSAELVETSRLFGRTNARIDPSWLDDSLTGEITDAASRPVGPPPSWEFGSIPRVVADQGTRRYPALTDLGGSVAVRLYDTRPEQQRAMREGTRRLLLLTAPSPVPALLGKLPPTARDTLSDNPYGSLNALLHACAAATVDHLVADTGSPAWDLAGFTRLQNRVRAVLPRLFEDTVIKTERILASAQRIRPRLDLVASPLTREEITRQLDGLVYDGFLTDTGWPRLPDVLRYLKAVEHRLDILPEDPHLDRSRAAKVQYVQTAYRQLLDELDEQSPDGVLSAEVRAVHWLIEEFRTCLFAPALAVSPPVTSARILEAVEDLRP